MFEALRLHYERGALHHAYLLTGDPVSISLGLKAFLASIFPDLANPLAHPDVFWLDSPDFTKERALALRSRQTGRAFGQQGRYLVVVFSALVDEAQEVLLKTFEEPPADTHFFLITPTPDFFRPTLLSRFYHLAENNSTTTLISPADVLAEKFLSLDQSLRSDWLAKNLLTEEEVNRAEILVFLNAVEKYIGTRVDFSRISANLNSVLSELLSVKKQLTDQRSSAKMLLDYLALILPVTRQNR
jgi:hypothetical protein